MNILAKILALPVKIVNILCKVVLLLAPITRIAGVLLYGAVFLILFMQYLFPLLIGQKDEVNPDWGTVISMLLIPTAVTFAEVPFLLLDSLTASLFKWLWEGEHRSTKSQILDYINEKRYNDMNNSAYSENTEEEIQEFASKLRDINKKGG